MIKQVVRGYRGRKMRPSTLTSDSAYTTVLKPQCRSTHRLRG